MTDDKKNIPDAGKADESPKPGKAELVKIDSLVQDRPPRKVVNFTVAGMGRRMTGHQKEMQSWVNINRRTNEGCSQAPQRPSAPRYTARGTKEEIGYLDLSELYPFKITLLVSRTIRKCRGYLSIWPASSFLFLFCVFYSM